MAIGAVAVPDFRVDEIEVDVLRNASSTWSLRMR